MLFIISYLHERMWVGLMIIIPMCGGNTIVMVNTFLVLASDLLNNE